MERTLTALYLLTSKSAMEETTRTTTDLFLKSDTSRRASGSPSGRVPEGIALTGGDSCMPYRP